MGRSTCTFVAILVVNISLFNSCYRDLGLEQTFSFKPLISYCLVRRDSNILLPKTPSMKRKRQESDEEQSSDDNASKTTKAHKTQGYTSPLTVITENELLDCSVTNEAEDKQDRAKRTTRATRANAQPKRQQPKRGSRKNNLSDEVHVSSAEDQASDPSSMDEKPRRNTRNSRKKLVSLTEEKGAGLSSRIMIEDNDLPKRATRNARKKHLEEHAQVSSAEELPVQPATKKRKSSANTRMKSDSGEIMASVVIKQEPVSPLEEMQTRRNTRKSRQLEELVDSEENETEKRACVPETPEPVVENVGSSPASVKTCKATINLVLQSPGFSIPNTNEAASVTTSSPCVEQDLGSHGVTVEENDAYPEEEANNDVVIVCSPTPIVPQEFAETCVQTLSENKEELENGGVENFDAVDANVVESNEVVDKENTEEADPRERSGRRSTQRNSGWRRKSKRSSRCLSPGNKRLSINKTVTKSKVPGKKSVVKSSVKLRLTQSKLMPELKMNNADKCSDGEAPAPNLEDVRVRLFDNLTSESSVSSATNSSSCSSTEDKAEAPVETIMEEHAEDESEEVFHDCRGSENEADDETEDAKCTKTNRCAS